MEVLSGSRHVTENLSAFNKAVGTHFVVEVVLYPLFSFLGRSVRISTDSFAFSVILKNEWRFTCNSYIQGESRSFGVVTHHSEVWRLLNPSRINTSATSGLQLLGLGGLLPFLYYCFAKINPLCVYRLQTFYCFVFIMHNRQTSTWFACNNTIFNLGPTNFKSIMQILYSLPLLYDNFVANEARVAR